MENEERAVNRGSDWFVAWESYRGKEGKGGWGGGIWMETFCRDIR